ncbi:hypothetical protein RHMOL_Rhmol02G0318500 [Rhododendron molle]|uniref:Uncharacterized protein n=1 Tax=Rhododendron molle TaxID=49168 RepID=A0ACC0PXQ5_RHOML|nr:hypothetical protein RHMOL_Rhmol02G0318500 [Rhododendron molle]
MDQRGTRLEPQAHSLVIGQQKIVQKIKEFVEKLNQILTIQVAQWEDENSQAITESHGNGEFYNNGTNQIGESKVSSDSQHLKCGENLMEKITLVSMLCGKEKLEEDVEENKRFTVALKLCSRRLFLQILFLCTKLTSTMLHLLALASNGSHQPIMDFLVKKASFLEEWLKVLYLSLGETSTELESENNCMVNQKKDMISRATWSLAKVYKSRNHMATAHKFEELASSEP